MWKRPRTAFGGSIAIGVAIAFSTPLAAQTETPDTYAVSIDIRDGDQLIASPRIAAQTGKTATMHMDGRYDISVTAAPDAERGGNVLLTYSISLFSISADVLDRSTQTSTVSLKQGEPFAFDLKRGGEAVDSPYRIELSVAQR